VSYRLCCEIPSSVETIYIYIYISHGDLKFSTRLPGNRNGIDGQ